MRIASFNINGIRAALKRGFADWVDARDCDVIGLQEVRCRPADLPEGAFGSYHVAWAPGSLAGRNGVALLTRTAPAEVRCWGMHIVMAPGQAPEPHETGTTDGLPTELLPFADEGRYIETDLADTPLTVACLYLPKGATPDPANEKSIAKQERKMTFLTGFADHLARRRQECEAQGRHFLVMGDFNIAHENADLKNWKANQRNEGFLPEERQWFDTILSPETLVDVVRAQYPDANGPYSWWSWRGKAFVNDAGWRIDYHLASPALANKAVAAVIDRDPSYEERTSDHAAVVVDYNL
ncbi:exodeoxyribonuclease III [Cutibacterium sp. WCA-380-WT-3A]|uniref:Exodeoxyribonuclease III n=1 Tax=Cutibacterium porci TaxID=2605781 RepID=A0A7K0J869_9ACTN|nr:exodeoxyribonuclease III [Cutibacterium porci]MSS46145.1 exodeoxyribonuclease III [Cutibacterium porci]